LAERERLVDGQVQQVRIEHAPGAVRSFLLAAGVEPGTPVAVEATGNWYWIVDEIEQAAAQPRLVHPRKAKLMMGMINKTDRLDVHGLNRLQRNGTLPTVWVPPGGLRDLRELTRLRMVRSRQRTTMKNRITATLAKYALAVDGHSDTFCAAARPEMLALFDRLPPQTAWACRTMLAQLQFVQGQIDQQEQRLHALLPHLEAMRLLMTLPGVGLIRAAVIALEVGDVGRLGDGERLASYAGTTPRVRARQRRQGALRPLARGRQPLPEVGVRRGRQRGGAESQAPTPAARLATVPENQTPQGPRQGDRRGGQALGGGDVSCAAPPPGVPRASGGGGGGGGPGQAGRQRDDVMSRA
jgi:transposase